MKKTPEIELKCLVIHEVQLHDGSTVGRFQTVPVSAEAYYQTHEKLYTNLRKRRILVPFDTWKAAQDGDMSAQAQLEGLAKI